MGVNSSLFPEKSYTNVIMNIICAVRRVEACQRRIKNMYLDASMAFEH